MLPLHLTIEGAPRTKKNHGQILKFGGRTKVNPSKQFLAWQDAALWTLRRYSRPDWTPIEYAVAVRATFYRDARRGDLIGYMQALADVLEKAHVLANDRQIVCWDGTRLALDSKRPRVELAIELAVDTGMRASLDAAAL